MDRFHNCSAVLNPILKGKESKVFLFNDHGESPHLYNSDGTKSGAAVPTAAKRVDSLLGGGGGLQDASASAVFGSGVVDVGAVVGDAVGAGAVVAEEEGFTLTCFGGASDRLCKGQRI